MLSRREFMKASVGATVGAGLGMSHATAQDNGQGSAMREYRDEKTGVSVRVLTPGETRDETIYQTHPMWTRDMRHLVFNSHRTREKRLPHALEMATGAVSCLAENAQDWVLGCGDARLYWRRGDEVSATPVDGADTAQRVAVFDGLAERRPISLSLDANGRVLYAGVTLEEGQRWGIAALELATGTWRVVAEVEFKVGHVQANPERPGLVMFCHETGGDAPQRTWVVRTDDGKPRPFYKETYDEWVTHEVWWGADRAAFTIWPYDDEHRRLPHGVASARLDAGTMTVHSRFAAWHVHGSPDGRYAVADDMARNIWLVRIETAERRLLTQGHNGEGFQTHPHPSFTPDGKAVVFNSSRNGTEDVCLAAIPDWERLQPVRSV